MRLAELILLALAPVASETIAPGHHRLAISGPFASVEAAQEALMPAARRLCGDEPPSFGTFRFSQVEALKPAPGGAPPEPLKLEQEIFCGAPPLPLEAGAQVPPDWQPSDADQRAVLAATFSYFAEKDGGRYDQAWSRLSAGMKQLSPLPQWREDAAAFNRRAGAVRSRRVTEISWYNNPEGAPQPGLYVATDFSAEFEKLEFLCGYVMWRVEPGGGFSLTREEQNMLEKERAKGLASIDRAPLRSRMGCKD